MRRKEVSLIVFLKGSSNPEHLMPGCANYDHTHGGCLLGDACKVEQGKRCGYFERSVLPTAADIGQREHVYCLYEQQVGLSKPLVRDGEFRLCPECGEVELSSRQRYCPDCTRKRRQKTKRENQRKYRAKHKVCA